MLYIYLYHKNWEKYHIQWKHKRRVKQEKYKNQVAILNFYVGQFTTCPMYDISRSNTSAAVPIIRARIFLQPLLIKFNVCLTRRWPASLATHGQTETCVFKTGAAECGTCDALSCISIYCYHNLITLVKFEQFQRKIFVQFILVLVVFENSQPFHKGFHWNPLEVSTVNLLHYHISSLY